MENEKYYKLIKNRINTPQGKILTYYQIQAVKSFVNIYSLRIVQRGELGGWIESEDNLAQDGSWIDNSVLICGNSKVVNSYITVIKTNESYLWGEKTLSIIFRIKINDCNITNSQVSLYKSNLYCANITNSFVYFKSCNEFNAFKYLNVNNSVIIAEIQKSESCISGTLDFYSEFYNLTYINGSLKHIGYDYFSNIFNKNKIIMFTKRKLSELNVNIKDCKLIKLKEGDLISEFFTEIYKNDIENINNLTLLMYKGVVRGVFDSTLPRLEQTCKLSITSIKAAINSVKDSREIFQTGKFKIL